MTTSISDRRKSLNTGVMLIVVFLALQIGSIFPDFENSPLVLAVAVLSSKGLYELIIMLMFWAIRTSDHLMRWYWGHLYLRGIWSYEYTLSGRVHFGVWDFEQDESGVQVIGNGLDENFQVRTIVRSVSPLIEEQGGYFLLNSRNELANDNARVFSKTTLLLDHPRRPWSLVRSMRATTEVFGGPSDRQLHPNVVFTRQVDADSIEDAIVALRAKYQLPTS